MRKVLVTGGCGYIGAHTIVDLINNDYEVISIDDLSRGSLSMLEGVERITGKEIKNYKVDLCNLTDTENVFRDNPDIDSIIHFAAYKSVPESVERPLLYFRNNLDSVINLLECARSFNINQFVFSSSCAVYGNTELLPVNEEALLGEAQSPYAYTKQVGEKMCIDFANATPNFKTVLLRYFNPVGAHTSSIIGELQDKPENLVPVITQTAIGIRPDMNVFGTDYDTRDGSCIRDYIHVMDIASAHTKALQYLDENQHSNHDSQIFNLGSGNGITVLELIKAFEKVSGEDLNFNLVDRRAGDIEAVYADNTKARTQLGWEIEYDLEAMMDTAWRWEIEKGRRLLRNKCAN